MAKQNRNQQPKFFWQGAGILLPVVVLSVVGLISLRQDERAAEQDARSRAAESAQSLARAMRVPAGEDLRRFLALQNAWTAWPRPAGQRESNGAFADAAFSADLAKWEHDYQELKLSECAAPQGEVLGDGRIVQPPAIPLVPTPPQWFCELALQQRDLLENLRDAIAAHAPPAVVQAADRAFLATHPSPDARQAAEYFPESPEQILRGERALANETGISFQDIACCQLLWATNAALSASLLEAVGRQLFERPSFVAPTLLKLAEQRTNNADDAVCENVRRLGQLWRGECKTREWLAWLPQSSQQTNATLPTPHALWTIGSAGDALAFCETSARAGTNSADAPLPDRAGRVSFIPLAVVEAIFARALAENKFLVPGYVRAEITVAGKRLRTSGARSADGQPLLGNATQEIGELGRPATASFDVSFYLTSRAEMLSTERRRAGLFGGLILAAFLAALAGLLAARRAFLRQLRLNELKSNFVSSVSHELRAPIASVRLMAESLELGKIADPQKQNEYFRFIGQEGRRLSSLIENVLDFSRIEEGRKQYEMEPTDLAALARETVNLMAPYAAEKGVRISLLRALDAEHSELALDGRAMQQALVNLIDNAIKHSPKGQMVAVDLSAGRAGVLPDLPNETGSLAPSSPDAVQSPGSGASQSVFISIQDHGEGIPPEEHERIFERFYRRGSELRRKTPGVGIGLSIVKHIVEAHGGRVHVRSAVGKGSRFVIELPLNPKF